MPSKKNMITAIQQMRKTGNTEEQIRQNLAELGVESDQIDQLLLLSQPNIQDVLQAEINESVHAQLENEKPKLMAELKQQMVQDEEALSSRIRQNVLAEQEKQADAFQQKISQKNAKLETDVAQALEISQRAREKVVLGEQRLNAMERGIIETPETPHKRFYKPFALILWILGIGLVFADVYYIFLNQQATLNSENALLVIAIAGIAAVLMYFSTLV
ncbi:MAG: hypothetical protein Q7R47_05965 [Candidatus Diapherotrites archaeon]|nr:hypothetical protein [Candidatus Diapherotrites archaeon]